MFLCKKTDQPCTNSCSFFSKCDAQKVPLIVHSAVFELARVTSEGMFFSNISTEGYINAIADD
jgi:hypothetical protein